ncbi:hypothetical protein D9611_006856 [Ephemerocybe angulata]|uniref:Serine/threonine-protein kinase RIO2 n=1 Tax=Ephemerocybe angulata TaxID=980116 RepID=A0A8H5B009_9AGAR|nr:hypothetical protein D9611_006856 [Tulosesus angulatus]
MKLDATDLRYITSDEFRVLTACEMGSKNHEVVPLSLITQISGLRNGGVNKLIGSLAKRNLVSRVQNAKYDGYRLTYGGYDYLAMRAMSKRDTMTSVGNQIGVGKESDIYIVSNQEGDEMVLKLHRLGRVSFRTIKQNRDYLGKRKSASWMYMSRLAAQKEYAFMKILHEHGFPVPTPIDQVRHTILMEFIDAYPLRQVSEVENPGKLYSSLMDIIVRFAQAGLIHGDYNEFNILIRRDTGEPIVIDFPQMVSTSHANAEWYFNRDVECIRRFFRRRFRYESAFYPKFKRTMSDGKSDFKLDIAVEASGFAKKDLKALEEYLEAAREEEGEEGSSDEEDSDGSEEEGDAEEEEEIVEEEVVEESEEEAGSGDDTEKEGEPSRKTKESEAGPSTSRTDKDIEELEEQLSELVIPDEPNRSLSRSPPNSRPGSPRRSHHDSDSEDDHDDDDGHNDDSVRAIATNELTKKRAQQQRKYHSKRSVRNAGRPQGSKAKQNNRVNRDAFWE